MPAAKGIFRVRIPLPFALNSVNCYVLFDPDGRCTIVDTGLNWPEARAAWNEAFAQLGIHAGLIRQIVLTHMHPDHFGMAGMLQAWAVERGQMSPVYLSPRDRALALKTWIHREGRDDLLRVQMLRCGVPADLAGQIAETGAATARQTAPHPISLETIDPDSTVVMGGRTFTALHAPGHSDGQLLFYHADDALLLSGDHVLMKITPNIGMWPDTEPDPLRRFLASLRRLQPLDVRLALPGHKTPITDWRGRIGELLAHHEQRLELTLQTVRSAGTAGATVYEVSRALFAVDQLSIHELRFAVAESLSHLLYLQAENALREEDGDRGVARYFA